jgi:tape measure domain-containing protein
MSVSGGVIVMELRADDGNFSVTMRNAGRALQRFQIDAEQTARSVKKLEEHQFSLGTRFRHFITTLGALRFAVMDINDVFVRMPMAILKTAGELERMQMLMTGLSKETEKTARSAEGLRSFNYVTEIAQKAPFEIGAISDAFVKLKVGGFDPAAGSLQAIIDATARFGGTGETLKRATIAIQQMMGKGVISMEELRQQLGEAVPTAIQDMADAMGMGMSELVDKISKGAVKSQSALDKMLLLMAVRNRGAAQEMMETWTGTVSQFQTQLQLASKEIADAGFAPAMKGIINEITALLKTDDFKRAAIEIGASLKVIVENITAAIKFFYGMADAIKVVAAAWVFLKIRSSVMDGLVKDVARHASAFQEWMLREKTRASTEVTMFEQRRQMRVAEAALDLKSARDAQAASNIRIIAAQNELRSLATIRLQQEAQLAAMTAAMAASAGRGVQGRSFGAQGFIAQAAAAQQIRDLEQNIQRNAAAQAAANVVVSQGFQEHSRAAKAVGEHSTRVADLARNSGLAYQAQRAMAAGASLASAGIALLGGPLGVVSIALTAGIMLWQLWGDSAAEAAARAERGMRRLSNQKDLDFYSSELKAKESDLKSIQFRLDEAEAGKSRYSEAQLKSLREQGAKLRGEIAGLKTAREKAEIDVAKAQSRNNESYIEGAVGDQLDATRRRYMEIEAAEASGLQKRVKQLQDSGAKEAEITKAREESARRSMLSEVAMKKQLAAQATAAANALDESLITKYAKSGNAEKDAIAAQSQKLKESAKQYLTEAGNAQKTVDRANEFISKPKKGQGPAASVELFESPLQKLIEKLRAENAELDALLKGTLEGDNFEGRIAAARAKILQQWSDGKFNYIDPKSKKKVEPTYKDVAPAVAEAEEKVRREQAIKDAEAFTKQSEDLVPRYKEALALLADPFSKDGKKPSEATLNLERMLEKLSPERLEKAGLSVDKLKAAIGKSITADFVNDFADLERETKRLQDEMTGETRRGAQARAEAEDEAHRRIMQNLIDRMAANGAELAVTDQFQQKLNANMTARLASTARKFETPMQKLVRDWQDSTTAMEQATARWAQGGMDAMIEMVRVGKFEWKGLVEQILVDMIRIQMQKAMAGGMSSIFSSLGSWATSLFSAATGTPMPMESIGTGGSTWAFANGGIMTPFGAADLRAYAAGGIAKSPQVAIYGEGSRPEAYVPLPDGRTIPVTVKGGMGGAAPSVVVNVINQSGQQVSAKQGQSRFDGRQMILDVVLSGMSQPGTFRDGMKNMMGA